MVVVFILKSSNKLSTRFFRTGVAVAAERHETGTRTGGDVCYFIYPRLTFLLSLCRYFFFSVGRESTAAFSVFVTHICTS